MSTLAADQEAIAAEGSLAAWATVRVPYSGIDALRAQPAPAGGKSLPARFLKNSDEQTVAGVAAVWGAIHNAGWDERSFADWAVLGAPRFMGRLTVAGAIHRFMSDPTYSVSPHIIPNQCLHSLSGTISVGLGVRGPNFGVGGGRGAVAEVLLAALSLLREGRVPGVWVVTTATEPDPVPDANGKPTNAIEVVAAALALTAPETALGKVRLRLGTEQLTTAEPTVAELAQYMGDGDGGRSLIAGVPGLGRLELQSRPWNDDTEDRDQET